MGGREGERMGGEDGREEGGRMRGRERRGREGEKTEGGRGPVFMYFLSLSPHPLPLHWPGVMPASCSSSRATTRC